MKRHTHCVCGTQIARLVCCVPCWWRLPKSLKNCHKRTLMRFQTCPESGDRLRALHDANLDIWDWLEANPKTGGAA